MGVPVSGGAQGSSEVRARLKFTSPDELAFVNRVPRLSDVPGSREVQGRAFRLGETFLSLESSSSGPAFFFTASRLVSVVIYLCFSVFVSCLQTPRPTFRH